MNRFISSPRSANNRTRYRVISCEDIESSNSSVANQNSEEMSSEVINQNENLDEGPAVTTLVEADRDSDITEAPEYEMCIRVLDLNGKVFKLSCDHDWTVARLKTAVASESGTSESLQRLIYRGNVMTDEKTLNEYKLEDGCTIHLFARQEARSLAVTFTSPSTSSNTIHSSNGTTNTNGISHSSAMSQLPDGVSGVVFPADTMRVIDPVMLDTPLGNSARRVKLWSSFLLIVYTMKVLGQFALLAHMHALKEARDKGHDAEDAEMRDERYTLPYYFRDPILCVIELIINAFGVYVGCMGFKVAHGTILYQVRLYCRSIAWLAIIQISEQIYITVLIAQGKLGSEDEGPLPSRAVKEHQIAANILHTGIFAVMWATAVHHSICHKRQIMLYNETLPIAVISPVPTNNTVQVPVEV